MPRLSRVLTLIAAVLLTTLYVVPLWSVRLVAPQYPEGLGMDIRVNTVTGMKEHDLRNINSLNHYIGMKAIEPDAIPELRYMPWILGLLIAGGVVTAALGRRRLLIAWLATFAIVGAAGLYDFWRWEYDYGHNLDLEKAVIIIPGMSYQPPLIGTKQLANFTASSWPGLGGVLGGVAFALGVAALVVAYRRKSLRRTLSGAVLLAATACASGGPQAIALGVDACIECRMVISDARFGGEIITRRGKALKFDSVDCLLKQLASLSPQDIRAAYVVDATAPHGLVPAESAVFVHEGALRAPMGTLVAVRSAGDARELAGTGRVLSWSEVQRAR